MARSFVGSEKGTTQAEALLFGLWVLASCFKSKPIQVPDDVAGTTLKDVCERIMRQSFSVTSGGQGSGKAADLVQWAIKVLTNI